MLAEAASGCLVRLLRFKNRPSSGRTIADAELIAQIQRVLWNRKLAPGISGFRKVWRLPSREGTVVARCTVERQMRQQGLRGIKRGKLVAAALVALRVWARCRCVT